MRVRPPLKIAGVYTHMFMPKFSYEGDTMDYFARIGAKITQIRAQTPHKNNAKYKEGAVGNTGLSVRRVLHR